MSGSESLFLSRLFFRLAGQVRNVFSEFRKIYYRAHGLSIDRTTSLPQCRFTFPYKVQIGPQCILEPDIYFHHDGIWTTGKSIIIGAKVFIGRGCEFNVTKRVSVEDGALIASGCKFVDHDHGYKDIRVPIVEQPISEAEIRIGKGAWLCVNVVVLKGVSIGEGAIVAAGAVVTRDVPPMEIWGGVPARPMAKRGEQLDGALSAPY